MKILPIDPFSGQTLNYRLSANGASYLLWGTGADGRNDNAAVSYDPTNGSASSGDLSAP